MASHWDRIHTAPPPNRLLMVPVTLCAFLLTLPFLVHWRAVADYGSPPARQLFEGLLVAGSLRDAEQAGFTYCIDFKVTLRCRRSGLMLMGHGPFKAAVDLVGGDGRGGFHQLTLWHDWNQDMPIDVAQDLERQGWDSCRTMLNNAGDQHIFKRKGSPLRISIDISYYGKRRIRIIPDWRGPEPHCL